MFQGRHRGCKDPISPEGPKVRSPGRSLTPQGVSRRDPHPMLSLRTRPFPRPDVTRGRQAWRCGSREISGGEGSSRVRVVDGERGDPRVPPRTHGRGIPGPQTCPPLVTHEGKTTVSGNLRPPRLTEVRWGVGRVSLFRRKHKRFYPCPVRACCNWVGIRGRDDTDSRTLGDVLDWGWGSETPVSADRVPTHPPPQSLSLEVLDKEPH